MTDTLESTARRGLLALVVTGVLWGSIGIVVRLLQDDGASAPSILFWRLICACLVLVPLLRRRGLRRLREQGRSRRLLAVCVGSLAFQLLYFFAVRDVGVAIATLVTLGLAPVLLAVGETARARALPPPRATVALVIALVGLALVTSAGGGDGHAAPHPWRGLIESGVSGVFLAASTGWSGRLSTRLDPFAITFATSVCGLVVLLPVVAVTGWHVPVTASAVGGTLWLGLITTVVAYGLFYAGLRSTPGSIAMIVTLLEPVTAVVLAAAVLDESLTVTNVVGGALLLSAVAALYLRPAGRAARPRRAMGPAP